MTQDKFKDLIEAPLLRIKNFIKGDNGTIEFWAKMHTKSTIGRTVRLTLQYPELAKKYLDSFPKVLNENVPTATDK